MAPKSGQAPFLQELSSLEVEPLQVIVDVPESGQESSLDTLTAGQGEVDVAALLTGKGVFPVNQISGCNVSCDGTTPAPVSACCCCFPCCLPCP